VEFSVSKGTVERLGGWRKALTGGTSGVVLDTAESPTERVSSDIWLVEVHGQATSVAKCPPIAAVSISRNRRSFAVLHQSDWQQLDDLSEQGAADSNEKPHTAVFFSLVNRPTRLGEVRDVSYLPNESTGIAWQSDDEATVIAGKGRDKTWLRVLLDGHSVKTTPSSIDPAYGIPKQWFFRDGSLIFKSARNAWFVRSDQGVKPIREALSGIAEEPDELVQIESSSGSTPLIAISKSGLYRVDKPAVSGLSPAKPLMYPFKQVHRILKARDLFPDWPTQRLNGRFMLYETADRRLIRVDLVSGQSSRLADGGSVMGFDAFGGRVVSYRPDRGIVSITLQDPGKEPVSIARVNSFYSAIPFPAKRHFAFKPQNVAAAADPNCCTATVYLPVEGPAGPLPLVVELYLGMDDPERAADSSMDSGGSPLHDPRLYTTHGLAFMVLQMPWGRGSKAGDVSEAASAFALPAIERAIDLKIAAPAKIALTGVSFGAFNVYSVLSRTHIAKAAILQAGVFDLVSEWGRADQSSDLLSDSLDSRQRIAQLETGQYGIGAPPWEVLDRYVHESPSLNAQAIKTPTLILNGDLDFVDVANAEFAYKALNRIGTPARLVVFFGEGHSIYSPGNMAMMAREILAWLNTHLVPARSASEQ
jgi:dipeptidyl aminopeptidase/acylaminoacyl peptidase